MSPVVGPPPMVKPLGEDSAVVSSFMYMTLP